MSLKYVSWLFPFLSFLLGYFLVATIFSVDFVETPALVGKSLSHSLQLLSDLNLHVKILAQKPDSDLPEGTIVSQVPNPGITIKPRQNVFIVCSIKPPALTAPDCRGFSTDVAAEKVRAVGARLKTFQVSSPLPASICVTHYPAAGDPLEGKTMIAYVSKSEARTVLFPQFVGKQCQDVVSALSEKDFSVSWHNLHGSEPEGFVEGMKVVDQKPRAGTLINLDKPPAIKFFVE